MVAAIASVARTLGWMLFGASVSWMGFVGYCGICWLVRQVAEVLP